MKTTLISILVVFLVGVVVVAQKGPASTPEQELMREKLVHSQSILAGLTGENFKLIELNAEKLAALAENGAMRTSQRAEYLEFVLVFRKNAANLARAARERNLEAATQSYLAVTRNCIECHKFLRGNKVAFLDER